MIWFVLWNGHIPLINTRNYYTICLGGGGSRERVKGRSLMYRVSEVPPQKKQPISAFEVLALELVLVNLNGWGISLLIFSFLNSLKFQSAELVFACLVPSCLVLNKCWCNSTTFIQPLNINWYRQITQFIELDYVVCQCAIAFAELDVRSPCIFRTL